MQVRDIELEPITVDVGDELSNTFYRACEFCDKVVRIQPSNFRSCLNLSRDSFFCPFCLRNDFHYKSSRNVLIMSFRGIIGYYYYRQYGNTNKANRLYYSEIETMILRHERIGLQSPVFSYDPITFLWFIDFNRIGTDVRKAPFCEVQELVRSLFECFEVQKHFYVQGETMIWDKFNNAVEVFYRERKRPQNRRMLIPTVQGCFNVTNEQEDFLEQTRSFTKSCFTLK